MALLPPSRRGPGSSRFAAGGCPARIIKRTRPLAGLGSILSEPIEAVGAQLGISHRMRNVAVAEVVLQRAGVDAIVGELEAAAMAQHVRMSRERKSGQFSSPADHFEEPGPRHRAAAFGVEDEAALQVLPSQDRKSTRLNSSHLGIS